MALGCGATWGFSLMDGSAHPDWAEFVVWSFGWLARPSSAQAGGPGLLSMSRRFGGHSGGSPGGLLLLSPRSRSSWGCGAGLLLLLALSLWWGALCLCCHRAVPAGTISPIVRSDGWPRVRPGRTRPGRTLGTAGWGAGNWPLPSGPWGQPPLRPNWALMSVHLLFH